MTSARSAPVRKERPGTDEPPSGGSIGDDARSIVSGTERTSRYRGYAEWRKVSGIHPVELHWNGSGHVSGAGLIQASSHKRRHADEPNIETGRGVQRPR